MMNKIQSFKNFVYLVGLNIHCFVTSSNYVSTYVITEKYVPTARLCQPFEPFSVHKQYFSCWLQQQKYCQLLSSFVLKISNCFNKDNMLMAVWSKPYV